MNQENFAEKWNSEPQKKDAFFSWIMTARKDIIENPLTVFGIDEVSEKIEICFGKKMTQAALLEIGQDSKDHRDNSRLLYEGLNGGITTQNSETSKKIGGHTFFGS